MESPGAFIISLDLELFWGMHDLFDDAAEYAANLEGAWEAVPQMLERFEVAGINATWATVGFLFARDPAELAALEPSILPEYANPKRSPYPLFRRLVESGEMDRSRGGGGASQPGDRHPHSVSLLGTRAGSHRGGFHQ